MAPKPSGSGARWMQGIASIRTDAFAATGRSYTSVGRSNGG